MPGLKQGPIISTIEAAHFISKSFIGGLVGPEGSNALSYPPNSRPQEIAFIEDIILQIDCGCILIQRQWIPLDQSLVRWGLHQK